jgi:hypothetical protein
VINQLSDFERKWNALAEKIKNERGENERGKNGMKINAYNKIEKLSTEELKYLLKNISEDELNKLIEKCNFDDR